MSKDRIYFNHSSKPSIGVEAELYTVSKQDYNLCLDAPAILETIDKLIPIAADLNCQDELTRLGDIAENNQAPYQRQISQYQKNNDFTDIIKYAMHELEQGITAAC